MKVCVFGSFRPEYNRNKTILRALNESRGVKVINCNDRSNFFIRSIKMALKALKNDFDVLLVPYPNNLDIYPAKIVSFLKRKPLIIDYLIYIFESQVEYGEYFAKSLEGKFRFFLEKFGVGLADKVILDNPQKVIFFQKEFGFPKEKFEVLPIGADETVFFPKKSLPHKKFNVLFYGRVMPIQGFEFICEAAAALEGKRDIEFTFIGANKAFRDARAKYSSYKNMTFLDEVPLKRHVYVLQHEKPQKAYIIYK